MDVGKVDEPVSRLAVAEAEPPGLDPFRLEAPGVSHGQEWRQEQSRHEKSAAAEFECFHRSLSIPAHGRRLSRRSADEDALARLCEFRGQHWESLRSRMNSSP